MERSSTIAISSKVRKVRVEGSLLIDTGAFIALLDPNDNLHSEAKTFYQTLPGSVRRFITQAVVGECYTFFRYRHGASAALRWLDYLDSAQSTQHLQLMYHDEIDSLRAGQILRGFQDQALSYTDALTLAVAERYKARGIFGFDYHLALTGLPLFPGRRAKQK
jgi:predicted nucleic acid-binding protein